MAPGLLRGLQRLLNPLEPEQVKEGEEEVPDVRNLDQCPLRCPVRVIGTLSMVTVNPAGSHRWLEAELDDGTMFLSAFVIVFSNNSSRLMI